MSDNNENKAAEAKRELSAYPYTSLKAALQISEAVKECGGARSEVSKGALASHLGEPEKGQSFLQRITSAKAFGLIEGRSDYTLTEIGKQVYFPTAESERSLALLECLATPTTFKELIKRFDGDKLPKREIIANILHRELDVPESWKDRAAAFFENSAQLVGVIDEKGYLRFKTTQIAVGVQSISAHTAQPSSDKRAMPAIAIKEFSDQEEHSLFLDKEKTKKFTINSPLFISRADYDRICKWIEVTLIVGDAETAKAKE